MSAVPFVHLHLHTEYSLTDGLIRIPQLVAQARACGMPALAITDQSNAFAAVKFYQEAENAGIKPILGAEVWLHRQGDGVERSRCVLLCLNRSGFQQLSMLLTRSYRNGQIQGVPHVEWAWLEPGNTSHLLALSGGLHGELGILLADGQVTKARGRAAAFAAAFPDRFYLEVARTGRPGEDRYVPQAIALADAMGLPLVASNDVRFLVASDFDAHEARVCIQEGRTLSDPRRPRAYTPQQYLR
ncbi:MAG: PHP domain-containing protein, partial [Gammaproteobacteria bacterium]